MAAPLKHVAIKLKCSGGWTLQNHFYVSGCTGEAEQLTQSEKRPFRKKWRLQPAQQGRAEGRNTFSQKERGKERELCAGQVGSLGLFTAPFEMRQLQIQGTRSKFCLVLLSKAGK